MWGASQGFMLGSLGHSCQVWGAIRCCRAVPETGFHPAQLGQLVQSPSCLVVSGASPGSKCVPTEGPLGRHSAVGLAPDWGSSCFGVWGGWVDPQGIRMTLSVQDGGHCPSSSWPGSCMHPSLWATLLFHLPCLREAEAALDLHLGMPSTLMGMLCIPKGCHRCHLTASAPWPWQAGHMFTST